MSGQASATTEKPPPVAVWRNLNFRRYWYAHAVSEFGDRVTELALPLIAVITLDASPSQLGILTAARWAPTVMSLLIGAWADHRPHKRRILVGADLTRAVVLTVVPVAYLMDAVTFPLLLVVALVTGLAAVFFHTSYPPFFVSLVSKKEYVDANSKLSISRSGSFIAGPAIGGALVQLLTAPLAVLVDALSFVYSALVIGRLRVPDRPRDDETAERLRTRVFKGARFVLSNPYLRAGLGCSTTINFFTFMAGALLVLFASRELDLSAGVIGLAFGIGSLGGLLGAAIAPRLTRRFGAGPMVVVGAIVFPAPFALLAVAGGDVWLAATAVAVCEFVSAVGVMLYDINNNSIQASVVPDGMRSRVSGAYSTVNYGCRPLGALLGGFLGEVIGIRETFLLAAIGGMSSVLFLLWSPNRRVRDVEDLEQASIG
jgi:predicted MFS family arabinose efflux permease